MGSSPPQGLDDQHQEQASDIAVSGNAWPASRRVDRTAGLGLGAVEADDGYVGAPGFLAQLSGSRPVRQRAVAGSPSFLDDPCPRGELVRGLALDPAFTLLVVLLFDVCWPAISLGNCSLIQSKNFSTSTHFLVIVLRQFTNWWKGERWGK